MKAIVIALHDVAPSTLAETARWRAIVAELTDGPVSLLLVPRYGGRDSWRSGPAPGWVRARAAAGDETVLHGYSHLATDGRDGRELAGRDPRAMASLIGDGLAEMRSAGLAPEGFIAPSYLHPRGADASCRSMDLTWWATRGSLRSVAGGRALPSIGLGASTRARRALSPALARAAAGLLTRAPVVRLDLHPADLHHERLSRAGADLLARLIDQGRRPITHAALAAGPQLRRQSPVMLSVREERAVP